MTNPIIKLVNAETGEEIEREMNASEFKQYETEQTAFAIRIGDDAAKATAKAALLQRLGITADEAALLLG